MPTSVGQERAELLGGTGFANRQLSRRAASSGVEPRMQLGAKLRFGVNPGARVDLADAAATVPAEHEIRGGQQTPGALAPVIEKRQLAHRNLPRWD